MDAKKPVFASFSLTRGARLRRLLRARYLLTAALAASLLFASFFTEYALACRRTREQVLRLHVIANSDSAADQAVKLRVRDAVLAETEALFAAAENAADAMEKIAPLLPAIEKTAAETLRRSGCRDRVQVRLTRAYFDTRAYGSVLLPAGKYHALQIVLGEGAGHNWWCVLFPPLCAPTAQNTAESAAFLAENGRVVSAESGRLIRFKTVETVEKWIHLLFDRDEKKK